MFTNLTSKMNGIVKKGAQIVKKGSQFMGKMNAIARPGMSVNRSNPVAKANQKGLKKTVRKMF